MPDTTQQHCYADSPNVDAGQGWWVTGRLQTGRGKCSDEWTSEIFTHEEEWIPGPQHPTGYSFWSCLANVNSTHTLYTGGNPTYTDSWLIDWSTGSWTQTGHLNEGRWYHGCAQLEGQGVLVAGGYKDDYVYSVELYSPGTGTWTTQPDLPQDLNPSNGLLLLNWGDIVLALFL